MDRHGEETREKTVDTRKVIAIKTMVLYRKLISDSIEK